MSQPDTSQSSPETTTTTLTDFETTSSKATPEQVDEATQSPIIHGINTELLDDPHLIEFLQTLSLEQVNSLIESFIDLDDIFQIITEVSDDEELLTAIDTITSFTVESQSVIDNAADTIESKLGMRPFEVQITEPKSEFQDPMVSTTVDESILLTNNPSVNATIISYATRIKAVTGQGQQRLTSQWEDALDKDTLKKFKQDRDPDALGFAHPELIPATGEFSTRTAITEIPYIGPAAAEEIHPEGKLMSIEDWTDLTYKQATISRFPVEKGYDSRIAPGIVELFVKTLPQNTTDALGKALNMIDYREKDEDSNMLWVCGKHQVAILSQVSVYGQNASIKSKPVAEVRDGEDNETILTSESGDCEKHISNSYWKLLQAASTPTNSDIQIGYSADEDPIFVELPDGNYLVTAPRAKENSK